MKALGPPPSAFRSVQPRGIFINPSLSRYLVSPYIFRQSDENLPAKVRIAFRDRLTCFLKDSNS